MIDVDKVAERAAKLGKFAAQRDKPLTACPYDPAGSPQQRVAAAAWVRAWHHWHPTPGLIDHGTDDA